LSKRADNLHDAAETSVADHIASVAAAIGPEPAPPRLHAIPGRVTRADLAVIIRAITLYLARNADLDDDTAEKSGKALAHICGQFLVADREQRSPRP
jgi:hypothetical protein